MLYSLYAVHIVAVYLSRVQPTFLPCGGPLGPSPLPACLAPPGWLLKDPHPAVQPGRVQLQETLQLLRGRRL